VASLSASVALPVPSGRAAAVPATIFAAAETAPSPPAVACYAGFSPSVSPRVDVVRLGTVCGPPSGLVKLARISGTIDEAGRSTTLRWDAERGDCFRVFAVAGNPAEDLDVEVKGTAGPGIVLANPTRRWAVVGEQGVFCAVRAGRFEASFTTHAGTAELEAAVWRGARMLSRGQPAESGNSR